MSKAMHAKPFRLTGPYTGRHARPESPRSKLILSLIHISEPTRRS